MAVRSLASIAALVLSLAPAATATPNQARQASCTTSGISASSAQQVQAAFTSAGLSPSVVPSFKPQVQFNLTYGTKPVALGNTFSLLETMSAPTVYFDPEKNYDPATTNYTLIYFDPDAPGPDFPILRSLLHMLEYDVKPSCIADQSPKFLATYLSPTPLSLAPHRYTYLVLRQPPGTFVPAISPVALVTRGPFDLPTFVSQNNLTIVGGNFMREGLEDTLVGVVPYSTVNGTGYDGPLNGTAEPANGVADLLG